MTNQYNPTSVTPTGSTLKELMNMKGVRRPQMAKILGVSKRELRKILRGTGRLTDIMAFKLELLWGTPAGFWMARERHYQNSKSKN